MLRFALLIWEFTFYFIYVVPVQINHTDTYFGIDYINMSWPKTWLKKGKTLKTEIMNARLDHARDV
jgi:hypothetical protein